MAHLSHLGWVEILDLFLVLKQLLDSAHLFDNAGELLVLENYKNEHTQIWTILWQQTWSSNIMTSPSVTPAPQATLVIRVGCRVNVLLVD